MEEFKLTEEEIVFTPNQLDRINQLREERERNNIPAPKGEQKPKNLLKRGDPVYVHLNDTKFTGKVEKVHGSGQNSWNYTYDISSPNGILKGLEYNQVTKRNLPDLSSIVVPEELKDLSAGLLLKLLRSTYGWNYDNIGPDPGAGYTWYQGKSYSDMEIKAALVGKPHVGNKRERQRVKEHKRKSK